jgi:hypothetical protein
MYALIKDKADFLNIFSFSSIHNGNPPANGKQGRVPEEMSQILLTNKKQGNLDFLVHANNIIKPM